MDFFHSSLPFILLPASSFDHSAMKRVHQMAKHHLHVSLFLGLSSPLLIKRKSKDKSLGTMHG